jgi:hypothetical protein
LTELEQGDFIKDLSERSFIVLSMADKPF